MDGLDEETRAAVIKKYIPDEPFGGVVLGSSGTMRSLFKAFFSLPMYRELFSSKGTAVISNPTQCLELMKKWEEARRQHCFAAACV